MCNTKKLMYSDCALNNRVTRWTFMDPWKSEVGLGALEELIKPKHTQNTVKIQWIC